MQCIQMFEMVEGTSKQKFKTVDFDGILCVDEEIGVNVLLHTAQ